MSLLLRVMLCFMVGVGVCLSGFLWLFARDQSIGEEAVKWKKVGFLERRKKFVEVLDGASFVNIFRNISGWSKKAEIELDHAEVPLQIVFYMLFDEISLTTLPRFPIWIKNVDLLERLMLKCMPNSVEILHDVDDSSDFAEEEKCVSMMKYHQHSLDIYFNRFLRMAFGLKFRRNGISNPLLRFMPNILYSTSYCKHNSETPYIVHERNSILKPLARKIDNFRFSQPKSAFAEDLFLICTHPLCFPQSHYMHDESWKSLAKIQIGTVDFDTGRTCRKDIIVPYVDVAEPKFKSKKKWLLFFAAGVVGPRQAFLDNYEMEKRNGRIPENVFVGKTGMGKDFYDHLQNSTFCLHLAGHTRSSSRLFSSIRAGCIPVIGSDWTSLPFSNFLDYSKFSIIVQESLVVNDFPALLQFLQKIDTSSLTRSLKEVAGLFGVDVPWVCPECNLNLYTLTLAEVLLSRLMECRREKETIPKWHVCVDFERRDPKLFKIPIFY